MSILELIVWGLLILGALVLAATIIAANVWARTDRPPPPPAESPFAEPEPADSEEDER